MSDEQPINEYHAILLRRRKNEALQTNLAVGEQHNPDAFAEALTLSQSTGMPAPAIERNPEPARRVDRRNKYAQLLQQYPGLKDYFAESPAAATIGADDIESLGPMEEAVQRVATYARHTAAGVFDLQTGLAGAVQAGTDQLAGFGHFLAKNRILPANPFAGLANEVRREREGAAVLSRQIAGDVPFNVGQTEAGVLAGLRSAGTNTVALAAGLATRNPEVAMGLMTTSVGGLKYAEAIEAGHSPATALQAAVGEATAEYLTERLPVGMLFGDLKKGTPFYQTVLRQLAVEIPQEQAATILQDLNDWVVLNPDKPAREFLNERGDAAYQTLIATVVGSGVQTGAIAGLDRLTGRLANDQDRAAAAVQGAGALRRLRDLARSSKARERSPDVVEEWVSRVAGEDTEDLYIDAETARNVLNQEGVDVSDLLGDSPSAREQFEEAVTLGGDVRIPVAEFTARLAGQEYAELLLPHVRIGADSMSQAEAEEFTAQEAARFQEQAETVLTEEASATQLREEGRPDSGADRRPDQRDRALS